MTTETSNSSTCGQNDRLTHDAPTIWSMRLLNWNLADAKPTRADVLRRLTEKDLFLTREETDAALFLAAPSSPELTTRVRSQFADRGTAIQLGEWVKAFSLQFFDLSRQERHGGLALIKEQCATEPGLMNWLERLSAGVNIDRPGRTGDLAFDRLVTVSANIFVARPREGNRLRQEFVAASREQQEFWGRAARKLHANHPEFTQHIARWTGELADWKQAERRHQQVLAVLSNISQPEPPSTEELPVSPGEWPFIHVEDAPESVLSGLQNRSESRRGTDRTSFPIWLFMAGIVLSAFRFMLFQPPTRGPNAPSPNVTEPNEHLSIRLDGDNVRSFLSREIDLEQFEILCKMSAKEREVKFLANPVLKSSFYLRAIELNRASPGTVTFDAQGNVTLKSAPDSTEPGTAQAVK